MDQTWLAISDVEVKLLVAVVNFPTQLPTLPAANSLVSPATQVASRV